MITSSIKSIVTPSIFAVALACAFAINPAIAQEPPRALCFLDSIEAEREEDSAMRHAVEMEVTCAHADRQVLGVAGFDLQLRDGDADLIEAGVAWMKAYQEANGQGFFSSQVTNGIEVQHPGRYRYVELRAHTHAIPETGVATLTGTVDLIVEADCVGEGAREPVSVQTTAGALRSGSAIALADGKEIMATEQGQRGDTPMLAISGAGSYVDLVEPPAGVEEYNFMGNKRLLVEAEAADDAPVTVRICPTEVISVPVAIEGPI